MRWFGELKSRVQRVSLRTKLVVPMVALSVLPVVGVGLMMIQTMRETLRQRVIQRVEFETESKARTLQVFLQSLHRDLRVMSDMQSLQAFARSIRDGRPGEADRLRDLAARELATFAQGRRGYFQIRYLNGEGHERLRLEMQGETPVPVPFEELSREVDEHYQQVTASLAPDEIYLSELRIDRETSVKDGASRRLLSCATPVVWQSDEDRGLLVLNVDPAYMFSLVGEIPPGAEAWVVNDEGIYLGYVGEDREKGALYGMSAMRDLSQDFGPREVSFILSRRRRASTFRSGESLVSVAPVEFDRDAVGQVWSLLIAQPIALALAPVERLTTLWWIVIGIVALLAAGLGYAVASYVLRPISELRRATLAVAGGEISRRVSVSTQDEIQDLASSFNVMADRLGTAQRRLESWNSRLREEVARQTERLRELQTGLARADKLATVGQMAASIMHEIGNPLAALKTKIQVAEEGGDLDPRCEALLWELLDEVERLAGVLHSFSRLGRLGEGTVQDLDLPEIVRTVASLVSPQLSRLDVIVKVSAEEEIPGMRGDPDQIRQLLINFLLNAAQASPDGGVVEVRVRSIPTRGDGAVEGAAVEIEDHGVGMRQEVMDRMWEPLFTTKREGTGLGLAVCRKIVEDHGGSVGVASRPDAGTRITVTFPGREETGTPSAPGAA